MAPGVHLAQFYCADNPSQKRRYVLDHDPYGYFVNQNSGLCLDVRAASRDDFAAVQQQTCNDTPAQHFLKR
jgi:hypothetical protein